MEYLLCSSFEKNLHLIVHALRFGILVMFRTSSIQQSAPEKFQRIPTWKKFHFPKIFSKPNAIIPKPE